MEFKDIISKIRAIDESLLYFGVAISGEVGELNNMIKKMHRDKKVYSDTELGYELADVFNYLTIIARKLNIDLEKSIIEKIDIINKRKYMDGAWK